MMRWVLLSACLASCSKPEPTRSPPHLPAAVSEAPATRLLKEWFEAFNAGDFKALHEFSTAHMPGKPDVTDERFRKLTGGFVIKRLEQPSPTSAAAVVKEQASEQFARALLEVDPKDPNHIIDFNLVAGPTPAEFLTPEQQRLQSLDAVERLAVIDRIAEVLAKTYVDADKAKTMVAALRSHMAKGDYDTIVDGPAFAERLTDDLHADTHDLHLRVVFGPHPKEEPPPPPEAERLASLREINYGFGPIERLDHNIARVVIDGFPETDFDAARKGIGDLMSQVADAAALIIDLRGNGGGSPETVALVASYVFDAKPVHLVDIYERETNTTTPSWTLAKLHGKRFGAKKPVFVLTSKRTFSGGEEFAYDLQTTKRAKLIGEATGGGAHPTKPVSLDDRFEIMVPFASSISPITHRNWEGSGVVPDVALPADLALDEALKRARAELK
jgi:retinol-binding protein 3